MRQASIAMAKGPSVDAIRLRATEQRWRDRAKQNEATRQWAQRKLDDLRLKREAAAKLAPINAVGKKPKRSKARGAKKAMLTEAVARSEINSLVTPEAQRHGDYAWVRQEIIEVTEKGERVKKERSGVRNLGGTAVERWHRNGRLEERQMTAIEVYSRAWRNHIGLPRVTANWSAVIIRGASDALARCYGGRLDDKALLRLFDQEIFFRRVVEDHYVWRNVVIDDEPAGIAGSRLGFKSKQAEAAALVIVQSISHEIATLVVDRNPPDLDQLLVDLDAPRRPGRRTCENSH